ncbi:hypothetical protein BZM27_53760 [Paraburkholderia steynii]|uniref:Uncharacterized protein n=1 Tax=Paraburkholderia steynii TaxID=1245441 RepID=A0A4R0X5Q5_9BURK|nr:hypothetical protein BZM27_53760 [Paraburkholderia steynii]
MSSIDWGVHLSGSSLVSAAAEAECVRKLEQRIFLLEGGLSMDDDGIEWEPFVVDEWSGIAILGRCA